MHLQHPIIYSPCMDRHMDLVLTDTHTTISITSTTDMGGTNLISVLELE